VAVATMMTGKRTREYNVFMAALLDKKFGGDVNKFARSADISYSQAHDIMVNGITDGRRLGTLKKVAKAFGVSLTKLISGK